MAYNKETGMYEGWIYIILNDIDPELVYIGQTSNTPEKRWVGHCHQIKDHTSTDKLHNKMEKYGKEHFAMDVLEHHKLPTKELLLKRLDEREIYLIAKFDSYYNGLNSTKGWRGASEHQMRAVLPFDLDGNFVAEYESVDSLKTEFDSVSTIYDCCLHHNTKYAYGSLWKYKDDDTPLPSLTDEEKNEAIIRYKMLLPIDEYSYKGTLLKTYKDSKELLEKNPQIKRKSLVKCCTGKMVYIGTNIYRFHGDDFHKYKTYRDKPKFVEQYDLDGNFIKVFESAREAARAVGLKGTQVSYCCLGRLKTSGGYMWKYVEDNTPLPNLTHNGHCVKVYQYDKTTGELDNIFESIGDTAKANKVKNMTISNIASGKRNASKYKYVWSFVELSKDDVFLRGLNKNYKPVVQLDITGNYIGEYTSATEAAKILFPEIINARNNITNACKKYKNSAYGFKWVYKNEYIGGDNVA